MPDHTATYSPEDNKLRINPAFRLDSDDYARAKEAGFRWCPKQEHFAASWSPQAEDIAKEFAGEVGDEDKGLVERAEERADRFQGYAESRAEEADAAHAVVERITSGIPLGQPILVGHHSEKHARRDAERIDSAMRKAVNAFETADYWKRRAAGALAAAKYKELPGVRARRIKKLEAEARGMERRLASVAHGRKFWTGGVKLRSTETGETRLVEITEEGRAFIYKALNFCEDANMRFRVGDNSWSAWDVLRPEGEGRYASTPQMTVAELAEKCLRAFDRQEAGLNRWLAHYNGRLDYERAMLAESGGTVADRTGPEVGGACRCWASPRGGWSLIQKVNKVSVTLLDNWGNGGKDFTRTIPFDKLSAVMSRAEVDAARSAGRLLREDKRGFRLLSEDPAPTTPPAPKPAEAAGGKLAALKATLAAGVQTVSANQLFPTPPDLARRMVELAEVRPGHKVLEPSAGTGRILDALPAGVVCTAVECNGSLVDGLRARYALDRDSGAWCVLGGDFLSLTPGEPPHGIGTFHRVVMNPPFENGSDIKHIRHAFTFLKGGGVLVALCAAGPRQEDNLRPWVEANGGTWEPLGPGLFDGTGVSVVLLSIRKGESR